MGTEVAAMVAVEVKEQEEAVEAAGTVMVVGISRMTRKERGFAPSPRSY